MVGTANTCMNYSGAVLRGTLTRQVFPGRPNYESVAQGDEPEITYVLKLDQANCVLATPNNPDEPALSKITGVQLVPSHDQYVFLEHMIDKRVTLSGALFAAHTGHHHTPVLLTNVHLESQ
jgi:hypothetical protein